MQCVMYNYRSRVRLVRCQNGATIDDMVYVDPLADCIPLHHFQARPQAQQ